MPDYGRKPLIRLMRRAQLMLWLLSVVFCGLAAGNVGVSEAQSAATPAPAGQRVVTLGADLDAEQQQSILRIFGVKEGESVRQLTVTNAEERALLGDELPADVIGSKAISSALVETTAAGSGIKVERYNITFVTPAMYGNALVTAGVKDARVVVAAPVPVSGTAALTGIFKAFEQATGHDLPAAAKETAGDELVTTGELAKEIGDTKAAELMARVKERVAAENRSDPAGVRNIVTGVAGDLHIELNQQQVDQITNIAVRIGRLNLEAGELRQQLAGLRQTMTDVAQANQPKNWLQRILDFLVGLFNRFFDGVASLLGLAR